MQFTVYINWPHNKAVGHIEAYGNAKIWGGKTTAAGGHLGPFSTKEDAALAGRLSGKPFHWCGICCKSLN